MTQTTADSREVATTVNGEIDRRTSAAANGFDFTMGRTTEIKLVWPTKGLPDYTPSDISSLFSQLNGALAVSIEAEHDLDHGNGSDPAIDHWIAEAEAAWMRVRDIQCALAAAPIRHASDRALSAMSDRARVLMSRENTLDFVTAYDGLRLTAFLRRRSPAGNLPTHVSHMLDECQMHLAAIASFDLYQPVCDPDDLPYELTAAWPEAC